MIPHFPLKILFSFPDFVKSYWGHGRTFSGLEFAINFFGLYYYTIPEIKNRFKSAD